MVRILSFCLPSSDRRPTIVCHLRDLTEHSFLWGLTLYALVSCLSVATATGMDTLHEPSGYPLSAHMPCTALGGGSVGREVARSLFSGSWGGRWALHLYGLKIVFRFLLFAIVCMYTCVLGVGGGQRCWTPPGAGVMVAVLLNCCVILLVPTVVVLTAF